MCVQKMGRNEPDSTFSLRFYIFHPIVSSLQTAFWERRVLNQAVSSKVHLASRSNICF